MSSRMSGEGSHSPQTSPVIPKKKVKDAHWANITDPEQRRRIQNRIAQRKFHAFAPPAAPTGEKARENREMKEREMRNREHAGNSYRIPSAADISGDGALSGLPWGSVNLGHVVSRGHEAESKRSSSGRNTYNGDASSNQSSNNSNNHNNNNHNYTLPSYGQVAAQPISYGVGAAAAAEGQVMEDSPYFYGIGPPLMPAFFTQ
ncbi:hypothetical protein G3M48_000960 [Beauveria asiatica]|uniref:BZIP domain-containing protein n=1 Tax=Beauveria asiatica TaxID=1069075 RepID=A0AAW0RGA8_9HYPO